MVLVVTDDPKVMCYRLHILVSTRCMRMGHGHFWGNYLSIKMVYKVVEVDLVWTMERVTDTHEYDFTFCYVTLDHRDDIDFVGLTTYSVRRSTTWLLWIVAVPSVKGEVLK